MFRFAVTAAALLACSLCRASSITDVSCWTLLQDPPNANLTAAVSPAGATLTATGPVPSGTDIGYATVNGADVASSTSGFYFDPASDFTVAVDYDLTLAGLSGAGGIGLGIGEDAAGGDSAGIGLGFANLGQGNLLLFSSAGRVNDVDLSPSFLATAGNPTGRFFVSYAAASGDVTVGVSPTPGAGTPTETSVLAAVQNQWDNAPLLVSFFLRSQSISLTSPFPITVPAMSAGTVTAVFSNFRVLAGTPITIPEPTAAVLVGCSLLAGASRRR